MEQLGMRRKVDSLGWWRGRDSWEGTLLNWKLTLMEEVGGAYWLPFERQEGWLPCLCRYKRHRNGILEHVPCKGHRMTHVMQEALVELQGMELSNAAKRLVNATLAEVL